MSREPDSHAEWSQEAFDSFCGSGNGLSTSHIHSRAFVGWVRAFILDMATHAQLPPMKVVPTARIIRILGAKAKIHKSGCLSADEFDSCTRTIAYPSPSLAFESEFAWSLFDTSGSERISREQFAQLRALWSELGLEDEGKEFSDLDSVTSDQYHTWFALRQSQGKPPALPPRASTAPSGAQRRHPPSIMMSARPLKPQDHVLRSSEVARMSLPDRSRRGCLSRTLTPSWTSRVKRPRGKEEISTHVEVSNAPSASSRLPNVTKRITWKTQQELWSRREQRFVPYQFVNAEYKKPDGSKGQALGTLLTGWSVPNKAATIPHSVAPEGARLGDARREARALQEMLCDEHNLATSPSAEPWLEEVARWKDAEHNVVVRINGIERLVPREGVSAASSSHSHSVHSHSLHGRST